jgi:hypothetical protein
MTTEQVSAAANVVSAMAIVLLIIQVFMARQQSRDDRERSLHEKAIDLLFQWASSVTESGGDARRFCERLTADQVEKFYKYKDDTNPPKIAVPARDRPFVERALKGFTGIETTYASGKATRTAADPILLTAEEIIYIRWHFISYTNLTEAVLSAWVHDTADKVMVQEQFKFLYERGTCL